MLTSQRITRMCLVGGRILPRLFIISNGQDCHGKLNNDINLTLELTIFFSRDQALSMSGWDAWNDWFGFLLSLWEIAAFSTCDLYYLWPGTERHPQRTDKSCTTPPSTQLPPTATALFTVSRFDCSHVIRCPVNRNNGCSQDPVNKQYKVLGTSSEITHDVRRFSRLCLKGLFSFFLSLSSTTQHLKPTGFRCPCCHAI